MATTRFLGLIFVLGIICGTGRSEYINFGDGQDQMPAANENSFSIQIPLGRGNVIQTDTQVQPAQRRLSLEDFFLNNNNNQQQQSQPAEQQQQMPIAQFQVQQPDPNSLFLVRDAQFPSPTGGLISRMLMLRRMLRLRRIARRLTFIPRMLGLGLRPILQRPRLLGGTNPLSLFSNRNGEIYNPREFVFGNKGFSYNNTGGNAQKRENNGDQLQQQTRGYSVEADPYYNGFNDGFNSQYDLDNSNIKSIDSFDSQEFNPQNNKNILNSLTNEQQLFLLQQLQTYQQQLNQLQEQLNNQPKNINIQTPEQLNDHQSVQYQQPQQNDGPIQANQYHQPQHNDQVLQSHQISRQPETLSDQQLEQVRQLQSELLKEQILQLQQEQQQLLQLQQEQQRLLQLQQEQQRLQDQLVQGKDLNQHQNYASVEQEQSYTQQKLAHQQSSHAVDGTTAGDRTEGYSSPVGIGNSVGGSSGFGNLGNSVGGSSGFGNLGNSVGVGINVGIQSPAVDIQVTKPVAPEIKPLPPIVNPIAPKPVPAPPKVEPLVPIGILPKPMLNLKGRLFFGAEMGKNVGVQSGVGR